MLQIDFDFKDLSKWENFYKFFKVITELSYMFGKEKVIVKETFKGFHIYCQVDIPPETSLTLRYYFGDDLIRIMYDEERLKYAPDLVDTLYEEKMVISITKNGLKILEHYKEKDVFPTL